MQSSASIIYSQNVDKQRILVVGKNSSRIVQLICFTLKFNDKKYSCCSPSSERYDDSPFIIIEPNGDQNLLEYRHHILIFSGLSETDKTHYSKLADATPKSGTIIYDESDPVSSMIAKIQRNDVVVSPYTAQKHEILNGKIVLITGTNEKITTRFSDLSDLKNCSAAKDLVKRIGISSSQFYRAISTF